MTMTTLRRLWGLNAILSVGLIVHLIVYIVDPGQTGGKSRSFFVLAALLGLFSLAATGMGGFVVQRLSEERLTAYRAALARFRIPFIIAAALLSLGFGVFMRPEWVYAHAGVVIAFTAILTALTLWPGDLLRIPPLIALIGGGIVVLAVIFVRIYGATSSPFFIITDEPWVFSWSYSHLMTGRLTDWMMAYGGADPDTFFVLPALWMRIVGVGWWELRVFALLLTFPVIVMGSLAACNLFNRTTGWLTAMWMFSSALVMGLATARHDVGLAVALAASLWLYSLAVRRTREGHGRMLPLHFAAGLAIGLGWFTHYHATGFGVALTAAFYLPGYISQVKQGKWRPDAAIPSFIAGGVIGALIVFGIRILPNWDTFLNKRVLNDSQSISQNLPNLVEYVQGFFANIENIVLYSQFQFLAVLIGTAGLLMRRSRPALTILLCIAFAHLILPIMTGVHHVHWYYITPLSVFYSIAIAALFRPAEDQPEKSDPSAHVVPLVKPLVSRRVLVLGSFAALIGLGASVSAPLMFTLKGEPMRPPPPPVAQWILDHGDPSSDSIVGQHYYFLWLYPFRYYSPATPELMLPQYQELYPTDSAVWESLTPTWVIYDRNLSDCCMPISPYDPAWLEAHGYILDTEVPGEREPILIYRRSNPGAANAVDRVYHLRGYRDLVKMTLKAKAA